MKENIQILLTDAKEGMQLAEDVVDSKGVCLMTSGSELSESKINVLKKRAIETINVFKYDELSDEEREKMILEIKQQLQLAFSKTQEEPLMQDLKQIVFDYRIREL